MTDSITLSELSDPLMPCFIQRFCKEPLTAISCWWAMSQLERSDLIGVYLNEVTYGWFVERIDIPFFFVTTFSILFFSCEILCSIPSIRWLTASNIFLELYFSRILLL